MFKILGQKILRISPYQFFLELTAVNAILVSLAIFFYGDKYYFWPYPFSYSGDILTQTGLSNIVSSRIYGADMAISGLIILALSLHYYIGRSEERNGFRAMLTFVAASGFLIAAFNPDDMRHPFHVLGSALVVATLWIMASNYIFEIRTKISARKYYALMATLQIPVFAYAGTYFANLDTPAYVLQKFALAGLIFTILYTTKIGTEGLRDRRTERIK